MVEHIDGLYFFTATCNSWQNLIEPPQYQKVIIESLSYLSEQNLCNIYGFVIMPNHIHLLLGVAPENTKTLQLKFLKYTSQQIIRKMKIAGDPLLKKIESTQADRDYHFWERRPKWKSIVHSDIFWQKLKYIHYNPLQEKWHLAEMPEDYYASSAASYKMGISQFVFLKLWNS